jgi:hypothetical protein
MSALLATLLFGLLWLALTGVTGLWNFLLGVGIGYGALRATQGRRGKGSPAGRVRQVIGFVAFFLQQLVVSTLRGGEFAPIACCGLVGRPTWRSPSRHVSSCSVILK